MENIFSFKSKLFADVFDECQREFKFEVFCNFQFKFYPLEHPQQKSANIFDKDLVEFPQITKAGDYVTHLYFVINSKVHVMDKEGMYDYAIITKGGYFGDISIMLDCPNAFSYMYDPDEEAEPPMLYMIEA